METIIEYPKLNSDGKLSTVYQKKYFICTKCSEIILSTTVKHVCRKFQDLRKYEANT